MKPIFLNRELIKAGMVCLVIAGAGLIADSVATAQTDRPKTKETSSSDSADPIDQKKLVNEIYQATQSASTAKDYSAILEKCDFAISQALTSKNRSYVVSLKGWALNRRGEQRFELAQQLKRVGNAQHQKIMSQALKDFDDAIISDPERYRSFISRGIAHMALHTAAESQPAAASLEKLETGEKDADEPLSHLQRAILDFTTVTKLQADVANGWFNRAEALYQFGAFEKSIEDYDVVLRLQSNDAQALTGRGHAKLALGRTREALADYEQVIRLHPENSTAFINRGDALAKLGEWSRSLADYEKSDSFKKSAIALQRLAWIKATCPDADFRNAEEALRLISQAITMAGDSPIALETLAAAEAANGDFDAATSTQEKAIKLVGLEENEEPSQSRIRLSMYEQEEAYIELNTESGLATEDPKSGGVESSADKQN